jgi:hypothetical protein
MHFCQRCRILKMLLLSKSVPALRKTSFARLLGLPRQSRSGDLSGDLSRSRTSGSLRGGGQNPDCRVDVRAVLRRFVFFCIRKQTGNPTGTNLPMSQNFHHLLDRMVPHSKLRCNFSDCWLSFGLV